MKTSSALQVKTPWLRNKLQLGHIADVLSNDWSLFKIITKKKQSNNVRKKLQFVTTSKQKKKEKKQA